MAGYFHSRGTQRVLTPAPISNYRKAILAGAARSFSSGDAGLVANLAGKTEQGEMS